MGDIIAIEKMLNIKGHNGFSPCRSCEIKGVRNIVDGETIYYVPCAYPLDRDDEMNAEAEESSESSGDGGTEADAQSEDTSMDGGNSDVDGSDAAVEVDPEAAEETFPDETEIDMQSRPASPRPASDDDVELNSPDESTVEPRSWDPSNLPLRTDESFDHVLKLISDNPDNAEQIKFYHGIKGLPILRRVGSLDRARSYPWDVMHLLFENIAPNLVKLWSGEYKKLRLDCGSEDYIIPSAQWEEIKEETAEAMKYIPSAFTRSLAGGFSKFNAEGWCFWTAYMAPSLLRGRFPDAKFYHHAVEFADIIKMTLKLEHTLEELQKLRAAIIKWVLFYERHYYQYSEHRLSICPLVIHGLLHIVDDILNCGPSWVHWTFYVERACGFLKRSLKARRYPWSNLNNRVLAMEYIHQLGARYDLEEELLTSKPRSPGLPAGQKEYPGYFGTVVRSPYQKDHAPDAPTLGLVAAYFVQMFNALGLTKAAALKVLPSFFAALGRFKTRGRRLHSRRMDTRSTAPTSRRGYPRKLLRSSAYVRKPLFSTLMIQFTKQQRVSHTIKCTESYGLLVEILTCDVPDDAKFGVFSGTTRLLAVIQPCNTAGRDAATGVVAYTRLQASLVVDLNAISAVVGRIRRGERWYIVDRTDGTIKPELVPQAEPDSEDEEI
ncbi:hypothetical protein MKEN_01490300 [Mycena kentingensis (nom. inval.)]|nr:hypothetical protein MKEN_01490300 [Mycena kentingensis (nom. inval.)]